VIAVDTNVLVHAHRRDSPFHDAARQRLAGLAEGRAASALPWPCVQEFIGILTHPRIDRTPTPLAQAIDPVDAWLESPRALLLSEGDEHWPVLIPKCVQRDRSAVSVQARCSSVAGRRG
jgi:hypothetical protein